eukprot:s3121_g10.t1
MSNFHRRPGAGFCFKELDLPRNNKAVVLARAQGQFHREQIAVSMRGCAEVPKLWLPIWLRRIWTWNWMSLVISSYQPLEAELADVELLLSEHHDGSASAGGVDEVFLEAHVAEVDQEVLLVSSPGYGVLDSGRGRTIIGADTLSSERRLPKPSKRAEFNSFRLGNGATEVSTEVAMLPCFLAGRRGVISAAVVQGKAPLLISLGALQALKACLDFPKNQIQLFDDRVVVPLTTNSAGQYVLNSGKCCSRLSVAGSMC